MAFGLETGPDTVVNIKVIGVEPAGAACMKASLEKGEVVTLPHVNTIADGTAVQTPGKNIFPYTASSPPCPPFPFFCSPSRRMAA